MKTAQISIRWICLLIAAGLTLSACGEAVEPVDDGSLEVTWEVTPRGCEASGIDEIVVRLERNDHSMSRRYDCANQGAHIDDLKPANYRLTVTGVDEEGTVTYEADPREVTVHSGETNSTAAMRLTARASDLEIQWRFADGRLCGANEVEDIELAIYDSGDYEVRRETYDCSQGMATAGHLVPGTFLIQITARSENGTRYVGEAEATLSRGRTTDAEVFLEPLDDGS